MSNFKLIKTAAALALGASVVTSAVVPTDASAASKYKIKNGKLVIAKTGKVAKGYVTYKSTVYKNGKKLTGLKGKTYYKAGKKATGTYKGAYYYKGAKKVTTGTYKGAYYVKGVKKVTTGLYNGRYYKSGAKATGTYKGAYYVKGTKKVTTGTYNGAYYVKGFKKVTTGLYKEEFYQDGKLSKGYAVYNSILYKDAVHNVGLTVFEGKLYDGVSVNKGTEVFEGKLYNGAVLATGLVEHAGLFYNEGALANGEINGVEYKDGVVVKYEVTSVKTINASEVEVTFSVDVDAKTAKDVRNYDIELNGNEKLSALSVEFKGDSKNTVIVRTSKGFTAGDKVVVQVKDEVATAKDDKKKIERFASEVFTFTASAKPELKSATSNGDQLLLTFDRPVNTATGLIKVDGKAITISGDSLEQTNKAGNYTYTVKGALDASQYKAGTHEVVIFDVAETARANSQVSNTLSSSYTITEKESIPEVASILADNANRFTITFTEAVQLDSVKSLVVKQGNHEYEVTTEAVSNSEGLVNPKAHIVGHKANTREVDPTEGFVESVTVVIPEAIANKKFTNPLYAADQKSATLDVSVKAFKDVEKFVGLETTKQVVLAKGTTSPQFIEKDTTFSYVKVNDKDTDKTNGVIAPLNNISTAVATPAKLAIDDVILKNADGVIIPAKDANYSVELTGNVLTVKLAAGSKYEGSTSYSVTLKKEKIAFATVLDKTASYNAENTKNNEISVTVKGKDDSNFKYQTEVFSDITAVENVFQLAYKTDMDASALKVENYTLDGKPLPAGTKIEFLGDKKKVQFTLPEQTIKFTTGYKLAVSTNVKTEKGQSIVNNLRDLDVATAKVNLKDNTSAELVSAIYLVGSSNAKSSNQIKVVFNEEVKNLDKDDVKVLIAGSTTKAGISKVELTRADEKSNVGTAAIITLDSEVNVIQSAEVSIIKGENNEITSKDLEGNKFKEGSSVKATGSTVDTDATGQAALATAKAQLDTFKVADYTTKKVAFEAALATAKVKVAKATTVAEVEAALAPLKVIESDAQIKLAAAQKAATDKLALDFKEANYAPTEAALVTKAKEEATKAINAAKTEADITKAVEAAEKELKAIKTKAQLDAEALAKAKTDLKASITAANAATVGKTEGNVSGNQVVGSKAILEAAVLVAEGVSADTNSTTQQLTDAKTTLEAAVAIYIAAVVA